MTIRDYSDDEDYYSQGFEKEGVVSIWVGLEGRGNESNVDTLQDLCGVGYCNIDNQESNCFAFELVDLEKLFGDLSYSDSFLNDALLAVKKYGYM